jgi:transposase
VKNWPKLTLACDIPSHLLLGTLINRGPGHDAPLLGRVMTESVRRVRIARLLADAGYDSESNHAFAREVLGIGNTQIALNRRGGRRWARTKYRRQMYRRFQRHVYRGRAQVECVISRIKRRLGAILRGRTETARTRELCLKIVTHNILLLAG